MRPAMKGYIVFSITYQRSPLFAVKMTIEPL